ncbi:hypothetical protein WD019_16105 [Fictibacillus sp. Mic-4]|uniref:hypothetical protein n=1 Tax=Fictibacillus sp. Mic-4 TaxID=3132826 RepID=UPI003CFB1773
MTKKVMVRAWEIARAAVVKFGGSAKEYLTGALKMAWAQIKKANRIHKMVIIGNKDTMTYTIERYMDSECVEVQEELTKIEYASVYNNFLKRGAKMVDFYRIEKGIKTFLGTKEIA